jgi:ParB family chromosome partitioning protein
VELFPLPENRTRRYGLISGYRRYFACTDLTEAGETGFDPIPALIREGIDAAEAYRAMVEENAVRAPLSPWEAGHAIWQARLHGFHPTIEAATDALHPGATRQKRARLRTIARLVEDLDGQLVLPERLTEHQLRRLAAAWDDGYDAVIRVALEATARASFEKQWAALAPLLDEHAEDRANPPRTPPRPGRPRRVLKARSGLTIRRERTRDGYILRCSGPEATSTLLDEIFERIEQFYTPG